MGVVASNLLRSSVLDISKQYAEVRRHRVRLEARTAAIVREVVRVERAVSEAQAPAPPAAGGAWPLLPRTQPRVLCALRYGPSVDPHERTAPWAYTIPRRAQGSE
jgi:hypothetical protein